jgi:uncharacterized membrane protein
LRKIVLLVVVLVLAAAAAGLVAGPAAAKSFSISDVTIDARVQPNGNVRVHESRTVDFSGSYHYVYWDYATKGSNGIKITGASGPMGPFTLGTASASGVLGTYDVLPGIDGTRVQLNFDLGDTSATFNVDYIALGAAKRWSDTAELYWQFIGAQTGVASDHVTITVHLPAGVQKSQVRAWAHGPLWGNVAVEPDASVALTVAPLPASTFVEARILFPAAALAGAPSAGGPHLPAVLAAEKKLADQANRDRAVSRLKLAFWALVGAGVPLAAIVIVVILYVRFGREPKPQFQSQYLRDIPQPPLPPALVGFIWRMGVVSREDASATLLDLVSRGVIDIERVVVKEKHLFGKGEGLSYKLTLHEEKLDGLLPYEHHLVNFLFIEIAGGWSLVLSDLKDMARTNRAAFAKGYSTWTEMAQQEGSERGYLDSTADRMAFAGAAAGFVAAVAAGAAAILSGTFWFFIGIPVSIALIFVARAVKRRSLEAAELHAQYAALERYMRDFGRLQEKPPDAVVLWQAFLVYAVVFGIADQVMKAMQVKVPEVMEDPAFRTMGFMMIAAPGGGPSPFSALNQSFNQAVSVATSSQSSGAGSGGGFSGGGGGGGGGGGFGAG